MPLRFALPLVLVVGLPVAAGLVAATAWRLVRAGLPRGRTAALAALRGGAFLLVVLLLARPEAEQREDPARRKTVAVLVDRSRSMSLRDGGTPRFERALALARTGLLPALQARGLAADVVLFDATAVPAPLPPAGTAAVGPATDLGSAVQQAVASREPAPLAVVALSDGAANRADGNAAGLQALVESRVPFVGVGFGADVGAPTLSLARVLAPPQVPPRQSFRVAALLSATGEGELPAFELMLLRDGRLAQTKRVPAGAAARFWSEGFDVSEDAEGLRQYRVELRPPVSSSLVTVARSAEAPVRVGKEKEFRVLFVQGALTWDFKFIGRALRGDPNVRVTGLSRTSTHSVFRQNVESAGELLNGFPKELSEIAPFRVVVLSDLKPADLQPEQQELLARFSGELGGGVLLLGGASTFDGSWLGSRLEQLLPVTFDTAGGVSGLDRPFHLRLTDTARRHPVFQLGEGAAGTRAWDALPTFTQYGRVLAEKPGAVVWARHGEDSGPNGPRILMAAQSYGSGTSAIVCVQNLWRWRLAKDSDPQAFDRFWRQLFRHLGQSGRQDVLVQVLDQELRPHADVRVLLERQPRPDLAGDADPRAYSVVVRAPAGASVLDQQMPLAPSRPVGLTFRAEDEGTYTVQVTDAAGATVASQPVEVRDTDRELSRTGRDLPNLRQWASGSGGFALAEEEAGDPAALVARVVEEAQELVRRRARRVPLGWNAGVMAALLALLGGEWALRRRWGLA
ncbi:MAG: vWA domain-containing protein [Vicinamibacteria bacterium]